MISHTIPITVDYEGYRLEAPETLPTLTSYVLNIPDDCMKQTRPAIVICPGGGYEFVSPREGEPVALRFCGMGCHAFVLNYSVGAMRFPGALMELSQAVAYVRAHAEEFQIDPEKIYVCGFSSGGHLAASLGVYWHESFLQRFLQYEQDENRPNGLILSYPVISSKEGLAHLGSVQRLMGKSPDEEDLALFSLEKHVSKQTPPTFLWHTADDHTVPVGNSLVFAQALRKNDVPCEMHIFPHGGHGLSLASYATCAYPKQNIPALQHWPDLALRFLYHEK